MSYPNQTQEIFELLSRGNFICENSPVRNERKLFNRCEEEHKELYTFFEHIGYYLEQGNGYYYFSKKLQNNQIEDKLEAILDYIDLVEFMLQYSGTFGVGFRTTVSELSEAVKANVVLKDRLDRIKGSYKSLTLHQQCAKVLERFRKSGYMALEDEHEERYLVLSSYDYIQTFLEAIEVPNFESA
ncbi:MAG: hypothetical protein OEW60_05245 [Thiovulaceae bacterium]|nr:hypothetical protein [Sulfurimonadaceae bacterium]